ncbi:MAG: hypothetical protein V3U08_03270, partial [Nitrospirales bacterium]
MLDEHERVAFKFAGFDQEGAGTNCRRADRCDRGSVAICASSLRPSGEEFHTLGAPADLLRRSHNC